MNIIPFGGDVERMSSYDFLQVINAFRHDEGLNKVRNDKFVARCLDECPWIKDGKLFHPLQTTGGKQVADAYMLSRDDMLLIGMRESKLIRRRVLQWINEHSTSNILQKELQALAIEIRVSEAKGSIHGKGLNARKQEKKELAEKEVHLLEKYQLRLSV